jgi:HPt (histidine-containing phosphotransfer) domain-containing protein
MERYDISKLVESYAGNEDLLDEILTIFASESPPKLRSLQQAVEAAEYKAAIPIAHSFANTTGALQAAESAGAAHRLEAALRAGDGDRAREECAALVKGVEEVLRAVGVYRESA